MSWPRPVPHAELVALDVLDVVLDASHRALNLAYPELSRGPEIVLSKPDQLLAETLVYQLACLQGLLSRYRSIVSPFDESDNDDDHF